MIETEQRLERATQAMAERSGYGLSTASRDQAIAAAESRGLILGREQQAALADVVGGRDPATVVGYAGTGKSATLGIARDGWESAGYRVYGAELSGIASEDLESGFRFVGDDGMLLFEANIAEPPRRRSTMFADQTFSAQDIAQRPSLSLARAKRLEPCASSDEYDYTYIAFSG